MSVNLSLRIQQLNSKGALCILKKQYGSSVSYLMEALKIICLKKKKNQNICNSETGRGWQEHYNYHGCSCEDCSLEACIEYSNYYYYGMMSKNRRNHGNENDDDDNMDDDDDKNNCIYRQPIFTNQNTSSSTTATTTARHSIGIKVLSKIVTYNLALAYHLDGDFKNSKRLYQEVYRWYYTTAKVGSIQEQHQAVVGGREGEENRKILFFLSLVAANNLAVIHRELKNDRKQKSCLEYVLSALQVILAEDKLKESVVTTHHNDYDERMKYYHRNLECFVRNTASMILQPPKCANAA